MESLEKRQLFSVVTVGNTTSVVNGDTSSIANLIAHPGSDGISFTEALTAANNTPGADTIVFLQSFDQQSINVVNLSVTGNVTIQGYVGTTVNFVGPSLTPGGDFQGGGRILSVAAGVTASISNITFEGGDATVASETNTKDAFGGAIENAGSLTVEQCTFYNNAAGDQNKNIGGGGAIYNSGVLNLDSSSFLGNETLLGNGAGVDNAGTRRPLPTAPFMKT